MKDTDLIRRGDAFTLFQKQYIDTQEGTDHVAIRINIGITKCIHAMQDIPAVDAVEVRHGEWEDVEIVDEDIVAENHTMIASMFCPVCKRYASTVYHYGNPLDMMNFCPNCGAKMDGEEAHNAAN